MTTPLPPYAPGDTLCTDLYQLTMLSAYFERGMEETAVFEFFVRRLPEQRNFLVAAGLEQLLQYLETLYFTPQDLAWLESTGRFSSSFLDRLATLRFLGDVDAVPEGTACFENEPLVRVTAPLPQAQLVETRLINILHFQTLIASKAARFRLAARDRLLVDFGFRRAHGREAGLMAARASWIAGIDGTATVEAGRAFGIPLYGTMAHSFVQAHADELAAFRHFLECFPKATTLLIDTFDTIEAARRVVDLAREMRPAGITIQAVRIDSGDLARQAREVRRILDAGDCQGVKIFASGSIDERLVARLVRDRVPIDGFGVGTHLDVSSDAPSLDCAYKLQEYAGRPTLKRSPGKATLPGRKQVFRERDAAGRFVRDTIALISEQAAGEPLLVPVMRRGRRVTEPPTLSAMRERARREIESLPEPLRSLDVHTAADVRISASIRDLAASLGAE